MEEPKTLEWVIRQMYARGKLNMTLMEEQSPKEEADWKARCLNQTPGNLKYFDCPICKNKGYIAVGKEDGTIIHRRCDCMRKRAGLERIEKSGLSEQIREFTFSSYLENEFWQKEIKETARRYLKNGEGSFFVISGCPGSGKSHICTAIFGNLLYKGMNSNYFLWEEHGRELRKSINSLGEPNTKLRQVLKDLENSDVLYIDDFLKSCKAGDEKELNMAYIIIDGRYRKRKKGYTVISTEKSIEDIMKLDAALGSRIAERSFGFRVRTPENANMRMRRDAK